MKEIYGPRISELIIQHQLMPMHKFLRLSRAKPAKIKVDVDYPKYLLIFAKK